MKTTLLLFLLALLSVTVGPRPDLTFDDLGGGFPDGIMAVSKTWVIGSEQEIQVAIANVGDLPSGPFDIAFLLSIDAEIIDPDIDGDDIVLLVVSLDTLPANVVTIRNFDVTVPDVEPGTHFVGAIVDFKDKVDEVNEDGGNGEGLGGDAPNTTVSLQEIEVVGVPTPDLPDEPLVNVESTPYLFFIWEPPDNPSAPVIDNIDVDSRGGCDFPNVGPGASFDVAFDYDEELEGDARQGTVKLFFEQTAFGAQARVTSVDVGGSGSSGRAVFEVCVFFGGEDEIDMPFYLLDEGGNSSNILTVPLEDPAAGKTRLAPGSSRKQGGRKALDPGAPTLQASNGFELLAYNIYRSEAEGVLGDQVGTVPATQTTFIDESTTRGTDYRYSVTAVFATGEGPPSAQAPNFATDIDDALLFDRITQGAVFEGAERSLSGAWGDVDNDGDADLFVTNGFGQNNLLFRNTNGIFTKIDMGDGGFSYSASWGDYDNDGDDDLFVANNMLNRITPQNNYLYRNDNGNLTRVNTGPVGSDGGNSYSGSWGDYDNDGHLDLFVANGSFQRNFLYHNNGDGSFTKMTVAQVGAIVEDEDYSSVGIWGDYDDDGNLDLYVANLLSRANQLYRNMGPPDYRFERIGASAGTLVTEVASSVGASWGDYDGNGSLDLFVANWKNEQRNFLYKNNGDGTFTKMTVAQVGAIVDDQEDSFGSSWGDYDNDGDLDLLVMNDKVANTLYENKGGGLFESITERGGGGNVGNNVGNSTGGSWADYNGDGALDMFIANNKGNNLLYLNKRIGSKNSISIKCIGTTSNRSAIGAKVIVTVGSSTQTKYISGQTGRGGQNSLDLIFGMGNATRVDEIVVEWPSGKVTTMTNVTENPLTITEPADIGISGRVTDSGGAGIADVTMTLSGDASTTMQTNSNGEYAFTNLAEGGSFTVTPSKQNFTFAPASLSFSNLSQNQTANFTGTATQFSISGRVTNGGGVAIADVTMTLGGDASDTMQTNSSGDYAFMNLAPGGSFTVTPLKQNFTFAPTSLSFSNLSQNQTANFTGTALLFSISGRVTNNSGGAAIDDVTMTLGGDASATMQTNSSGDYAFMNLAAAGNYTVTPSKQNFTFDPTSLSFSNLNQNQTADFKATEVGTATEDVDELPKRAALYDNFPNPFAGSTTIQFALPKHTHVTLTIYNLLGKEVETLLDRYYRAGRYEAIWHANDLAGGVYFYRLQAGDFVKTRQMLLVR